MHIDKNITILFRPTLADDGEYEIARSICPSVITRRADIPHDSLIIGRYSVLPYYKECAEDCAAHNSALINSPAQHGWIASFAYYHDISHLTFPSWTMAEYPFYGCDGPVVLKGVTNSMKMKWNTHMFAASRADVWNVASRLYDNDMIAAQGLIVRQYIPLETVEDSAIGGLPITKEYRLFFYKNTFLAGGFYFANLADEATVKRNAEIPAAALEMGRRVADIAQHHANFFVVDVAKKRDVDEWICVEINDGQMSGLSATDPTTLYTNLITTIRNDVL